MNCVAWADDLEVILIGTWRGSWSSLALWTLLAQLLCLSAGCSSACPEMNFASWKAADRVDIKKDSKTTLRSLTDQSRIAQIASFADEKRADWKTPMAGTPVANVALEFYSHGQFLGHLGIGENFLESQGCNGFVSRNLTKADRGKLVDLIGIADEAISK